MTGQCLNSVRVLKLREGVPARIGVAETEVGETRATIPSLSEHISIMDEDVEPQLFVSTRPAVEIGLGQRIKCNKKLHWQRIGWIDRSGVAVDNMDGSPRKIRKRWIYQFTPRLKHTMICGAIADVSDVDSEYWRFAESPRIHLRSAVEVSPWHDNELRPLRIDHDFVLNIKNEGLNQGYGTKKRGEPEHPIWMVLLVYFGCIGIGLTLIVLSVDWSLDGRGILSDILLLLALILICDATASIMYGHLPWEWF